MLIECAGWSAPLLVNAAKSIFTHQEQFHFMKGTGKRNPDLVVWNNSCRPALASGCLISACSGVILFLESIKAKVETCKISLL